MFVERHGSVVLGIDDKSKDGRISTGGAARGVNNERATEPPATKALINSQAADQAGR